MKRRGAPPSLPSGLADETETARTQLSKAGVGGYGMPLGDSAPIAAVENPLGWSGEGPSGKNTAASGQQPSPDGAHQQSALTIDDETKRSTSAIVLELLQNFAQSGFVHPTVVDATRAGFVAAGYPDVPSHAVDYRVISDDLLSSCAVPRAARMHQQANRNYSLLDLLIQHARDVVKSHHAATGGGELRTDSSRSFAMNSQGGLEINGLSLTRGDGQPPQQYASPMMAPSSNGNGSFATTANNMASPMMSTPANNFEVAALDDLDIAGAVTLGRGASGRVLKVVHRGTGTVYAVKEILTGSSEAHKQIASEISVMWGTKRGAGAMYKPCPFLVAMKGAFFSEGVIYVAMELMDGSLKDILSLVGSVSEVDLRCIVYQVLQGVHYLHNELRRLHRDIKPHNMLFRAATGEVKIADFGLASEQLNTAASNQRSTFCGTIAYMSPERATGSSYSFETDLWSVGMTAYHLIVGQLPIPESSQFAVLALQNNRPSLPPTVAVSDAMREFISMCFAPPSQGVLVAQLLEHPWMQGLSPELCQGHLRGLFAQVQRAQDANRAKAAQPIHGLQSSSLLQSLENAF